MIKKKRRRTKGKQYQMGISTSERDADTCYPCK